MATIRDVAREAGVSIATVSRVFNDSSLVSPPTVAIVRDVAARLNYWPNGVARSLITSRTNAIGVLLTDLCGEFFAEVIRGIDVAARRHGLHLLVGNSQSDGGALPASLRALSGRVEGMIVMAPTVDAPAAIRSFAAHCPLVVVNPPQPMDACDTVGIANEDGAYEMVRHLLSRGHRRIGLLRGPAHNTDAQCRRRGYHRALEEAGLAPEPALEVEGDFTAPSGHDAMRELLARPARPTAVFAANDLMAIGAMGALRDAGLSVPDDLAIAGFDDIATARFTTPPLTSVRVNTALLGERAVELLRRARRAGDAADRRHEVLPTSLAIRVTCGPPRAVAAPARRGREPLRRVLAD